VIAYTIGELAELGGVSRRTVRYYVQEGLIPAPTGLGRGAHYGKEHLEALLRVKSMQERGLLLEEIRGAIPSGPAGKSRGGEPVPAARTHWSRIELLPGVELHVSSRRQIPRPSKLEELAAWCRDHFRDKENEDA
jgi:DNA-binding transcriptional MerR regulator